MVGSAPTDPDDWLNQFRDANGDLPKASEPAEPLKMVIAHLHPGDVANSFKASLLQSVVNDLHTARRLVTDRGVGLIETSQGAGRLERGRNAATASFLDDFPDADLMCFIDSDMGWDPLALEALAQTIEQTDHHILGALCVGAKPVGAMPNGQHAMEQEWFPTVYRLNEDAPGFDVAYDYPPGAVIEVGGTGAACLMVTRTCLEAMREAEGDRWYDPVTDEHDVTYGEDMSFMLRARKHGYAPAVHTGVKTSHKKDIWLTESFYREMRRPAASAVTVVIPVKDQLVMTRNLVGQLMGQGGWTDLLIMDNGSTDPEMREWLESQNVADVFDCTGAGIHEMWNAGLDEAVRRHHGLADVVFLNNDLVLGPRHVQRLIGGMRESTAVAACGNYDGRPVSGVQPLRGIAAGREDGTGGFAGFCFALRAEFIAGGYRFPVWGPDSWYFGDNDLVATIDSSEEGAWYGMVGDAFVQHIGGGGQTSGTLVGPSFEDDQAAFAAKWSDDLAPADAGAQSAGAS